MKNLKNNVLSSLIERKTRCKFTRSCSLYSKSSYTCTHVGGEYCGKYRTLTETSKNKIAFALNEELTEELIQQ